jgi:hypothetical protein
VDNEKDRSLACYFHSKHSYNTVQGKANVAQLRFYIEDVVGSRGGQTEQ